MRVGKQAYAVMAVVMMAAFTVSLASGEESKDALKAQLREVRAKKARIIYDYDAKLHDINKEREGKISKVKADYREAYDKCAREMDDKSREARRQYENSLGVANNEEASLIKLVGPEEENNFAKTSVEKLRSSVSQ